MRINRDFSAGKAYNDRFVNYNVRKSDIDLMFKLLDRA